ncbi:hypothetical protein FIBSPDRAFT_876867 [Athelia psychrophila]|uniref:Uncharacterized protein n=1 Tax=Athelia psychrophila TaxID=1759441 RepID=A0A167WHN5_9AGAM|nr:hypothetical protein FIBSPDRAFT_876867 [Fibularhizoctonia sp. CBS 109695]
MQLKRTGCQPTALALWQLCSVGSSVAMSSAYVQYRALTTIPRDAQKTHPDDD